MHQTQSLPASLLMSAERIKLRNPADVRFWPAMLNVQTYDLRVALHRVGTLGAAVERELAWHGTVRTGQS